MSERVAGAKLIGRGGGGDAACDSSKAGMAVNADRVRRERRYTACRRWRVDLVEKVAGTGLGLQRVQQRCSSGLVGGQSVWRGLAHMCEGARRAIASPQSASRKPRVPRRAGPTLASESKTFRNRREKLSVRTERQVVVVAAAEGEEEEDAVRTVTLLDKRSSKVFSLRYAAERFRCKLFGPQSASWPCPSSCSCSCSSQLHRLALQRWVLSSGSCCFGCRAIRREQDKAADASNQPLWWGGSPSKMPRRFSRRLFGSVQN